MGYYPFHIKFSEFNRSQFKSFSHCFVLVLEVGISTHLALDDMNALDSVLCFYSVLKDISLKRMAASIMLTGIPTYVRRGSQHGLGLNSQRLHL